LALSQWPWAPGRGNAAPPSRFAARRHHRVAGHQADVVCLSQSGERACASALLSRPQDLRKRSRSRPLTGDDVAASLPPPPRLRRTAVARGAKVVRLAVKLANEPRRV